MCRTVVCSPSQMAGRYSRSASPIVGSSTQVTSLSAIGIGPPLSAYAPLSPGGRGVGGEGVWVLLEPATIPLTPNPSPARGEGGKHHYTPTLSARAVGPDTMPFSVVGRCAGRDVPRPA